MCSYCGGDTALHSLDEDLDDLCGRQFGQSVGHHLLGGTLAEPDPALLPLLQQALRPHCVVACAPRGTQARCREGGLVVNQDLHVGGMNVQG